MAEQANINLETFKPGYVHPKFQNEKDPLVRDILEPLDILIKRLINLEEKGSENFAKVVEQLKSEDSKCSQLKEILSKMNELPTDGVLSVSQMRQEITQLKSKKDQAAKQEEFKLASKYKGEIERLEGNIKEMTEISKKIDSEVKSLQKDTKEPDKLRQLKISWREILLKYMEYEFL